MTRFCQGHDCINLCRVMEQTNYFYLLISDHFKEHLNLWKIVIIKKWCLTTVSSAIRYYAWQLEEVSCWQRAFCVAHVIAEVLFVFLLIHYYNFLCNFNVILLILISFHDPERPLLLAQVRGFFTALICWKSPWANTHLKGKMLSDSI